MKRILVLILSIMLFSVLTVTVFAENNKYIYVSTSSGSDQNLGYTPETAVRSINRAMLSAITSGADRAVIVLTDVHTLQNTQTEIAHKIPFTYTTNDGKVDYGASGAKLVFGKGLRFVLNGETTFENITIEYSGTLNCVAQYNPITFGNGVVTTRLDNSASGLYVVGGWQSPGGNKAVDLDSHITINSGSFAYVIGGARQGTDLAFTGTHHITVNGGKIQTLYAGSAGVHTSQNAILTVNGGRIIELYCSGAEDLMMQGNVTATFSGGELANVYINNVIGDVSVVLQGATVDAMAVSYNSTAIEKLHKAAGGTCRLAYRGVYAIEEYTGFDAVQNNSFTYAKADATGDGRSESTPASFEEAMKTAATIGGSVRIIGKISLNDYVEPVHDTTITLEGASADAMLQISGTYTLAGETCFEKLTLDGSGTFDARNGFFVAADTIKHTSGTAPAILGSASLGGGVFSEIRAAETVIVCGGAVQKSITGGSGETHVTVYSGNVGTVKTTDTSIREFSLAMLGGSVGKVIFRNVTEALSLRLVDGKVAAYAVEGTNVKGKLFADEKFSLASLAAAASSFEISREAVFFLCDGASGSGKSALDASSSLTDAYAVLSENGGTLVVCGPYTLIVAATGLKNKKPVVITSVYDGIDYAKRNQAEFVFNANFYCGGDTEFRDITLVAGEGSRSIYANCHTLVLGENITCQKHISSDTYISVMGGNQSALRGAATSLTIYSGRWQKVRGGSAADGSTDTTVTLTVNGGEFYEYLTLGGSGSHSGDIHAEINGGTFYQGVYASTLSKDTQYFKSNVSLVIRGGTFYGNIAPALRTVYQYPGSYSGRFAVEIQGGNFDHLTEMLGTSGRISGMASSLKVSGLIDLDAPVKGTVTFSNPVKVKSDPWLFYHDGYYYLTGSAANGITVCKATNISDLQYALYEKVYTTNIKSNWSAEIHHYTDEEVGVGNGGWYCYIGSPEDGVENATRRMYVIKCLDGDNLLGRWGNPVTGEVNVPQRVMAPDVKDYANWWGAGQSCIRINGKVYALFVSEVGRETAEFHQTINIMEMENPWTLKGDASVICVPEYDWEKVGYSYNPNATGKKAYPAVVEGATALYADDGTVFLTYTGSGVWTTEYQIGFMKYLGGDPLDAKNWQKNPTSILYKSDEICGTGHGSFVQDTSGQTWICYHAYMGTSTGGSRYAIAEPVYADKNGVVIGKGTGIAAPLDTVYEAALNPMPLGEKISGFDTLESSTSTEVKLTIGSRTAYINGEAQTLDAAPINRNNRTMLPVRFLANTFGVPNEGIKWDAATRTATLTNSDVTIVVTIGAPTMTVNGKTVALDSPAIIENDRTYLPVRAIANALGVSNDNIAWDAATNTATLKK